MDVQAGQVEGQKGLVAVVGLGQIGGSIARRLSAVGYEVIGADPDPQTIEQARIAGAIKTGYQAVENIQQPMDAVFLAAWPESVIELLSRPERLPEAKLITDCASIKSRCESACDSSIHEIYVGGHPMAGNEGVGFSSSDPDLFQGRTWVLCPSSDSKPGAIDLANHFVRELQATPIPMSAQDHDREVALLSHLPNLLANLLTLAGKGIQHPELAAGTWSGATRVAGSNPELWAEIQQHNQEHITAQIDDLIARLQEARNSADFKTLWQKAAQIKNNQGW